MSNVFLSINVDIRYILNCGIIPPKSIEKLASITFMRKTWVRKIEANDPWGNKEFSHDYTIPDLEKINWT